jgi:hypothetical protein
MLYIKPGEVGIAERKAEEARLKLGTKNLSEVLREFAPDVDETLFDEIKSAVRIYDPTGFDATASDATLVIVMLLSCAQNRASERENSGSRQ